MHPRCGFARRLRRYRFGWQPFPRCGSPFSRLWAAGTNGWKHAPASGLCKHSRYNRYLPIYSIPRYGLYLLYSTYLQYSVHTHIVWLAQPLVEAHTATRLLHTRCPVVQGARRLPPVPVGSLVAPATDIHVTPQPWPVSHGGRDAGTCHTHAHA